MRILVLAPDEESLSPKQAIEQAKNLYGSFATVVALPSSNNTYASLYFSAQALIADQLVNILIDSKDETYYNIEKEQLLNDATTQFREILEEVEASIREKMNK